MLKSFGGLFGIAAAFVFAQTGPQAPDPALSTLAQNPFSQGTLVTLADSLFADIEAGKVELAFRHASLFQYAMMGMHKSTAAAAEPGTASVAAGEEIESLRSRFLSSLKQRMLERIPHDASSTAPLLPAVTELRNVVEKGKLPEIMGTFSPFLSRFAKLYTSLETEQSSHEHHDPLIEEFADLTLRLRRALRADDVAAAEALAPTVLQRTWVIEQRFGPDSLTRANLFDANDALGRGAFKRGDYEGAKGYLLEAVATQKGASMSAFGPSMKLAESLLQAGYAEVVIEFLTSCKRSWKNPLADEWIAALEAGQHPNFGPNLKY
jgi:hypothetical protein